MSEPIVGTGRPRPFVCPACRGTEEYFGRLVFESELASGEPILCPNHPKKNIALVEVIRG